MSSLGFDDLNVICPTRSTNKYHALQPVKNNTRYFVVVSVQNDLWGQAIVVRSPLQVSGNAGKGKYHEPKVET